MTDKQYKKYKEIEEEIKPIKTFWKGFYISFSSCQILTLVKPKTKFRLKRRQANLLDNYEIELPNELQDRILKVIKQYIDEKEKEQKEL